MNRTTEVAVKKNMPYAYYFHPAELSDDKDYFGMYLNPHETVPCMRLYRTYMEIIDVDGRHASINYKEITNVKTNYEEKKHYGERAKLEVDRLTITSKHNDYIMKILGKKGNRRDIYIIETFLRKIIHLGRTGNLPE